MCIFAVKMLKKRRQDDMRPNKHNTFQDGYEQQDVDYRTDEMAEYESGVVIVKAITKMLKARIDEAHNLLYRGETDEAAELLELCQDDINEIGKYHLRSNAKTLTLQGRVDFMYRVLGALRIVQPLSEQERQERLEEMDLSEKELIAVRAILQKL